tara:strand:- start:94 stop:1041 length:948 start_codon:yes stop_codon:yes gene_type:complete
MAACVLFLASLGLGWWSHYLRVTDQNAFASGDNPGLKIEIVSSVSIEVHNHYPPGKKLAADEDLAEGWEKFAYNGRDFVRRIDNEIMDLGTVKVTTVAVLDHKGVVQWRYRIFSMIEGAAWDIDSWTVFRNADGEELSLEELLKNKRIREQIDASDIVFALGLASNLKDETVTENLVLARKRAEWLAMSVARFSAVSGAHRWSANMGGDPGEETIHGKVYMVPLGEANEETELGDPNEPLQRAAVIVGVDINKKDPDLAEMLSFVVAPEVSATTDLSNYTLSQTPTVQMREIGDLRAQREFKRWPGDYSVSNPDE